MLSTGPEEQLFFPSTQWLPSKCVRVRDGRMRVQSHDRQSLAIVVLNDCLIGVFSLWYSVVINFVTLGYEIHSWIIFDLSFHGTMIQVPAASGPGVVLDGSS